MKNKNEEILQEIVWSLEEAISRKDDKERITILKNLKKDIEEIFTFIYNCEE